MVEDLLVEHLLAGKQDATKRSQFYRALCTGDLYVVGTEADGEVQLSFYEEDGRLVMPVFSSAELFRQVIPNEQPCYVMKGEDFFLSVPANVTVILNPFTDVGKEFARREIRALIDGLLFEDFSPLGPASDEKVMIGQPKKRPEELLQALTEQFENMPEIHRAFLAQICIPSSKVPPHPLIGIEWNQTEPRTFLDVRLDLERFVRETAGEDLTVTFYEIQPSDSREIARYLIEVTPSFYP